MTARKYIWIGPNTTNPVLDELAPGTYTLQVTDANGCSYTTDINLPYGSGITNHIQLFNISINYSF
jgi:hypothetical protein